ncbi:MAG: cation transporter [Gemmatimonadaceae bacterium]|nr:cation transporter [Gemmatimonadaceae bacterium]
MAHNHDASARGIRATQAAMLVNTVLAITKLVAGLVGNAYALVADAVESTGDILSSTIVLGALRLSARDPDGDYPFGYGKAESVAAAAVSLMLLGAAVGIAVQAILEIRTPHHAPAPWTLGVLVTVIVIKWVLARRVAAVGNETGSPAVKADSWHHFSDAITSAAAFVGISIAVIGGPGWESADDWGALAASCVIAWNGAILLKPALHDLMDRAPGGDIMEQVRQAANDVDGVRCTEKLAVRRAGAVYFVDIHVQADPDMPLHDAHVLSGRVKGAIRSALPQVQSVLVHMEPYEGHDG